MERHIQAKSFSFLSLGWVEGINYTLESGYLSLMALHAHPLHERLTCNNQWLWKTVALVKLS